MKVAARLGIVIVTAALAAAVPAIAKTHPTHPSHPSHPATSNNAPTTSRKCTLHKVAYIASGTVLTWTAAQTGTSDIWNGPISITVTHANHHAKQNAMGGSYTLTNTKVTLGKGVTMPATGDRVVLIGKITEAAKKCGAVTGSGAVTVRKVDVKAPKTHP